MKLKSLLLLLSLSFMASVASAETYILHMTFEKSNSGHNNWMPMSTYGIKRVTSTAPTQFYRTYISKSCNPPDVAPKGYTYYDLVIQSSANASGPFTNLYSFSNIILDIAPNQKIKTSLRLAPYNP